jgi:hypothetical protein
MTFRRTLSIFVAGSLVAFGCGSDNGGASPGPSAGGAPGAGGATPGAGGTTVGAGGGTVGAGGGTVGAGGTTVGAGGGTVGAGGTTVGAGGGTVGAGGGTVGAGGGTVGAGGSDGGVGGAGGALPGAGGASGTDGGTSAGLDPSKWAAWKGFKVSGPDLVDDANTKIQLRGFGLGGWLFPEPYEISWDDGIGLGPTAMRKATEAKIGKADSDAFWTAYRTNYVTRDDLAELKKWGFNSVRLPFNANSLMPPDGQPTAAPYKYDEAEFAWVDKAVQWASEVGIYVILDMHGAPGGQNTMPKVSDATTAQLFSNSATYLPRMVDLWKKLSQRYRSSPWVIGYDLMNEPIAPNASILNVYKTVTTALRADGDTKIMVAEAGNYAMDFVGIASSITSTP